MAEGRLELVPCTLEEANEFIDDYHRHHQPKPVAKFAIAASCGGMIVGVVIVGLPKARLNADGWTLEVTRLATDGTKNTCSLLYGAAKRATFALGYSRLLTYTLAEETGSSLKASGFVDEGIIKGHSWKSTLPGRRFVDNRNPICDKRRWSCGTKRTDDRPRVDVAHNDGQLSLIEVNG